MKKIQYSALNYYNSIISEECLCLGVLFHDLSDDSRTFNFIQNFKRLEVFNDEINIDFVKSYLRSIKDEVETSVFNYNLVFNMKNYTDTYVNEFRFTRIFETTTDDSDFIEHTTRLLLKYDLEKNQRLSRNEEERYIREFFKTNKIHYVSKKSIAGIYDENISFDFITDQFAIKLFKYKDKNLNNLVGNAKMWSYNARELSKTKKVIFLYDVEISESKEFNTIINILSEHAYKTLSVESGIQYMLQNMV